MVIEYIITEEKKKKKKNMEIKIPSFFILSSGQLAHDNNEEKREREGKREPLNF